MYDAYHRVFERCGLTFRPVEAQSGEMGGDVNHEFMAVAAVGEDDFVWCQIVRLRRQRRGRAARARRRERAAEPIDAPPMEKVHTPDMPGIAPVAEFFGVDPRTSC